MVDDDLTLFPKEAGYSAEAMQNELNDLERELSMVKRELDEARLVVDSLGNEAQRLTIRRRQLLDLKARIDGTIQD